jgi:predicted transcriptional regulator
VKYRSRTDIVAQILETANGGNANKTKIMYGAYLSYAQLKEYIGVMLESGLLEQDATNNQLYRTTEKGWQFLKLYSSIGQLAGSGGNDINNASSTNAQSSPSSATTTAATTTTVKLVHNKKN